MSNQNLGIAPAVALATIGPIIAKAKTIISKVAPLLQNIFSSKATKALRAQRGEYEAANAQLRAENTQLDSALAELRNHGAMISQQMRQQGINGLAGIDGFDDLGGFFSRIIDRITGKTKATQQLNTAKEQYEQLTVQRDQKLSAANEMIQQLDALQKRLQDAIAANNSIVPGLSNQTLLIGSLAIAAVATAVVISNRPKSKTKK